MIFKTGEIYHATFLRSVGYRHDSPKIVFMVTEIYAGTLMGDIVPQIDTPKEYGILETTLLAGDINLLNTAYHTSGFKNVTPVPKEDLPLYVGMQYVTKDFTKAFNGELYNMCINTKKAHA